MRLSTSEEPRLRSPWHLEKLAPARWHIPGRLTGRPFETLRAKILNTNPYAPSAFPHNLGKAAYAPVPYPPLHRSYSLKAKRRGQAIVGRAPMRLSENADFGPMWPCNSLKLLGRQLSILSFRTSSYAVSQNSFGPLGI